MAKMVLTYNRRNDINKFTLIVNTVLAIEALPINRE
jgi:hypothetical protein